MSEEPLLAHDKLRNGLMWMFENGIPEYYELDKKIDDEALSHRLDIETGNYLRIPITYDERFDTLYFRLHGVGKSIKADEYVTASWHTRCFLQEELENNIVEYWVVYKSDLRGDERGCLFFITESDSISSERRVLIESDQYIREYLIGNNKIEFPENDLGKLLILEAWRWPDSFKNSDLANTIIDIKNGELIRRRMNIFDKIYREIYY